MFTTSTRLPSFLAPIIVPILVLIMLSMWVNAAFASDVPRNSVQDNSVQTTPTDFSCSTVSEIPESECNTLLTLYTEMDNNGILAQRGWLTTDTPCSWNGVTCEQGTVVELALRFAQLGGDIPTELENLSNLVKLEIVFSDQLRTIIPPSLGNLSQLKYLHLEGNQLYGTIPATLGNLSNLDELWLHGNQLTGAIPAEIGNLSSLTYLRIHGNQLSGTLPAELGQLSNLIRLWLSDNRNLNGPFPATLTNLSNLEYFYYFDTSLCEPQDQAFQSWKTALKSVLDNGTLCPEADSESPDDVQPPTSEPLDGGLTSDEGSTSDEETPPSDNTDSDDTDSDGTDSDGTDNDNIDSDNPGDDTDSIPEEDTPIEEVMPPGDSIPSDDVDGDEPADTDSSNGSDSDSEQNLEEESIEEENNEDESMIPPPGGIGELDKVEISLIFLPMVQN